VADRPSRLFVAVPVPSGPLAEVSALIEGVREGPLGRVPRWVQLETLHLTVRFLGDTQPDDVPAVADSVAGALAGFQAFDVELAGAGSFPPSGKPRTLWLGLARGATELGALAAALSAALEPLGWPADTRPYRPHLTVARLDAASRADGATIADVLAHAAGDFRTTFRAERAVLYRSHLGGSAPRHEAVREVALRD
jgi:2'-5' RNA ligase